MLPNRPLSPLRLAALGEEARLSKGSPASGLMAPPGRKGAGPPKRRLVAERSPDRQAGEARRHSPVWRSDSPRFDLTLRREGKTGAAAVSDLNDSMRIWLTRIHGLLRS